LPADSVKYIFGKQIYKQSQPVKYTSSGLVLLDSQYDTSKFVGETTFLAWRNPNVITFVPDSNICGTTGCNVNMWYIVNFGYNSGNATNASLSISPSTATGFFQILSGSTWIDTGISITNINTYSTRIKAKTLTGYAQSLTGTIVLN
jgi:hypothetical protein